MNYFLFAQFSTKDARSREMEARLQETLEQSKLCEEEFQSLNDLKNLLENEISSARHQQKDLNSKVIM